MAKPKDEKQAEPVEKPPGEARGGRREPYDPGYATVNDTNPDGSAIRHTE